MFNIETSNTNRAVRYAECIKKTKISGKNNRDITEKEYQRCLKDCNVFKGLDNINEMLDCALRFTGEPKKVKNNVVENNLHLFAHKGSDFASKFVLTNLHQWRSVVSLIKNGAVIVSLKTFNGYVDQTKKIPQYIQFRFGLFHIKFFFGKDRKNL